MTYARDVELLELLEDTRVSVVHLIRHAKAKNRLEWTEPDDVRPLTKRGRREAPAIAERLQQDPPNRLVSSPYVRCIQTLEPLALALDLAIETTDELAEGAGGAAVAGRRHRAPDGRADHLDHGTSYRSRASCSIAADAELHAITSALTSWSTSRSMHSRAKRRTSAIGQGP